MKPHSFVLLPTPGTETDRAPDELLELTPGVHVTTCPDCAGQAFVETVGSVWCTPRLAALRPALNTCLSPCRRCRGRGSILDYADPARTPQTLLTAA